MTVVVVVVLGVVVLGLVLAKVYRALRRLQRAEKLVAADTHDRGGLVRARLAGVRVGLAERRRAEVE